MTFLIVFIIGIIVTIMHTFVSQRNKEVSTKKLILQSCLEIIASLSIAIVGNMLYDNIVSSSQNETGKGDYDNDSSIADLNNDGKITTADAKWVLQYVSGSRTLTDEQIAAADVNGDGKITTVDAKWILQTVSGSRVLD